jgi:hypothetical protein
VAVIAHPTIAGATQVTIDANAAQVIVLPGVAPATVTAADFVLAP